MTVAVNKDVAAATLDSNLRESKGKEFFFLSKFTALDLGIYRRSFYYKFGRKVSSSVTGFLVRLNCLRNVFVLEVPSN